MMPGVSVQIVDNMESNQEDIIAKVEELKGSLAELSEAADAYNTQLLLTQERLEKLPALQRLDSWMDDVRTQFASEDLGDSIVEVSTLLSRCVVAFLSKLAACCFACSR